MGESFGAWTMGHDAEVMGSITSANVACGFHGGDPEVMRHTVRLARRTVSPSAPTGAARISWGSGGAR